MDPDERLRAIEKRLEAVEKLAKELAPHCAGEEDRRLDRKARDLVRQMETGSRTVKALLWFLTALGAAVMAIRELGIWAWFGR